MLAPMQSFGSYGYVRAAVRQMEDQEFTSLPQGKSSLCLASVGVCRIASACQLSCTANLSIFNNGDAECYVCTIFLKLLICF